MTRSSGENPVPVTSSALATRSSSATSTVTRAWASIRATSLPDRRESRGTMAAPALWAAA